MDLGGKWEDDAAAKYAELQSALALSMQPDAQADGGAAEGAAASAEQPPPQEQPPAVAQPPAEPDASPPVAEAAAVSASLHPGLRCFCEGNSFSACRLVFTFVVLVLLLAPCAHSWLSPW